MTSAAAMVESCLLTDVAFLNANGLMHFDAHFGNILLTDGRRLYIADPGLAASPRFDLSAEEASFLAHNRTHDTGYALRLVNWLVADVCEVAVSQDGGPVQRNEYIRACAAGAEPTGAPAGFRSNDPPVRTRGGCHE